MDKTNHPRKKNFGGSKMFSKKHPKNPLNGHLNHITHDSNGVHSPNSKKAKKKPISNESNFENYYESEMYNKEKPRKAFSFHLDKIEEAPPKKTTTKNKKYNNSPNLAEGNTHKEHRKKSNSAKSQKNSNAYKKETETLTKKRTTYPKHISQESPNKRYADKSYLQNKPAAKVKTKFISEDLFSDDFSYDDNDATDKKGFLKKREEHKKAKSMESLRSSYSVDRQKKKKLNNKHKLEIDLVRLNKFIAEAGICSRREADVLITQGEITVNQEVVTELGKKINPKKDIVRYKGKVLKPEKFVYVLLNKPKDYITTTDDEAGRKTVMDLVANACQERIYPVGRLDRNTTGLLLLTNDGELAAKLTHPSFEMKKVYQVALNKPITEEDFNRLLEGVELKDGVVELDDVAIITPDRTVLGIELHSGRNRVVRRLFEHLGYEVEMLDRTMFAGLTKKNLPRGKWRLLTPLEVNRLKYMI